MRQKVKQLFLEALEVSGPATLIEKTISVGGTTITIEEDEWQVEDREMTYVIAVGKASLAMSQSLQELLEISGDRIICVTPEDQPEADYALPSSHPVPDQKSIHAAKKLIQFIEKIPAHSTVFFAISGGTSALICKPAEELCLSDINQMNQLLLESGANIEEINSLRKHLSAIKGGQLLSHFKPDCTLIDIVISDVPADNLEIIGSGPTTPDSSTFQDAYDVLLKYDLWEQCSESVQYYIKKGLSGDIRETLKPGHDPIKDHRSYIIGSAQKLAKKAAHIAEEMGLKPWVADHAYNQPVEQVADYIMDSVKKRELDQPAALIFYGESTVEVKGKGKGGRNQELALRGAMKISNMSNVTWLSAGTDGIDGPTDAAGAIVDSRTIKKAEQRGIEPSAYLENNDSYHFHEQMDTLLKTGPTGNNVMDIVMVLLEK